MRELIIAIGLLAITACANGEQDATWRLAPEDSRVSYVTIKSGDVAETNHFANLTGEVQPDGAATIEIALSSVETLVDIRNERMRDILFKVADFPTAAISADIDLTEFETLDVGARVAKPLDLKVAMHGAEVDAIATVFVTRLTESRVLVETVEPVLLYADDFGFAAALDEFKELVGLPSISRAVPVTASLVFER